jgi:serine/threonine-protein kinase RsbW
MRRSFASVPASIAEAVHFAERATRAAGLPDEAVDRVTLAAGEAAGNAVEHGSEGDAARLFVVEWEGDAAGGWLRVCDEGPGIAPEQLASADLPADPLSTSGRGLFLMRTLADDARVEAGGRCVALWFAPRVE